MTAEKRCNHSELRRAKTGGWFCVDGDCGFSIPELASPSSNERAIPELDLSWQAFLGNQLAPLAGHEYDVARRAYVASWYASRTYAARSRDETTDVADDAARWRTCMELGFPSISCDPRTMNTYWYLREHNGESPLAVVDLARAAVKTGAEP